MFIGEMGCWLVIGAVTLYHRYKDRRGTTPLLHGGYASLNDHDSNAGDMDDEEHDDRDIGRMGESFSSLEPHNPVVKTLLPEQTESKDRLPLRGWRVALLGLPACCDIVGTTFMNAGLLFVAASIYQMTRGALVLFVGVFSVLFLKHRLMLYQWSALVLVVLGVAVVGLAGAISPAPAPVEKPEHRLTPQNGAALFVRIATSVSTSVDKGALLAVVGVLMTALAQIFTATQFVLEEYILHKYTMEPLKLVAWEGLFGFSVTVIASLILYAAVGRTPQGHGGYFDAATGWQQVLDNRTVAVTSVLIMFSIGGFNYFGLAVTRSVSSTARSTIDTCRTLFIWIVSLGLGWETFKWLQVIGFVLMVYGTFLFNDIVQPPLRVCMTRRMQERENEHTQQSEEPVTRSFEQPA